MDTIELLKGVEAFDGLSDSELSQLAAICREAHFAKGQTVTTQGDEGDEFYIIRSGLVEVGVSEGGSQPPRTVINLGVGQVVGEMALVDRGPRSATVRCVTEVTASVIGRDAFEQVCQANHHLGMVVYRNLAADLSFKMRHRHLARR
jgi:CRP/FNR family transcriptional regulator, cyclic AMP receptor protein